MLNQPFFQVALPIMVTLVVAIWVAQWSQNKRFDDLKENINERFKEVNKRLDKIENILEDVQKTLKDYGERIVKLETQKWR